MGFLNFFTDIFESLFMGSSPEVKKKQALHKIDVELRNFQPSIYKAGYLQPNFAELFRILHENAKPLDDLLSETISNEDVQHRGLYENQLLLTGFTGASQEKLEKLNADNRKDEVESSNLPMSRVFENQKHTLEFLIKELNTPDFVKIDEVIAGLQQLTDICRFNYISIIHSFDSEYNGFSPGYEPKFVPCVPDSMASAFQDFYYLSARFNITSALGRALIALAHIHKGEALSEADANRYLGNLRKIKTVLSKYLTPELLLNVIRLAKKEPELVPQIASYKANSRQKFANYMQEKFTADETRIKSEIKDKTITADLQELFAGREMEELYAYNVENSNIIRANSTKAYNWITPMQIIKTFLKDFFDEKICSLLNDIVIEGFFENPSNKTDFSTIVYSCLECHKILENFEKTFERGGDNDQAIIDSYIRDGRKDADFIKKLESTVDNVNNEAHRVVQTICTNLFGLYKHLQEILVDSKKTKPDIISNIRVLFSSTRNRDNAAKLEQQFEMWSLFLEIMKNYAVIGEVERK